MATIKPFSGIRPKKQYAKDAAALPYDVYSRAEAKQAVKDRPLSFLNIDRPETQFPDEMDMYAPCVYEKARELFRERMESGIYFMEKQPVYYLYELTMAGRRQTGLVCCASLDDYESGVIKRHENTRKEKEEDRIRHVDVMNAQTGPVFLAYRGRPEIRLLFEEVKKREPEYDFCMEDGVAHRVWVLDAKEEIEKIEEYGKALDSLYIADGHHRAASAAAVCRQRRREHPGYLGTEAFNFFLAVLFPQDELCIMDYNRVVGDLGGWAQDAFLTKLQEVFELRESFREVRPVGKGEFGMFLGGHWYRLRARAAAQKRGPVEGLDVSFLQREVLDPILGIRDPSSDPRIDFVGGIRGLAELEERAACGGVAFSLYPTSMEELFAVADAGKLMPPKSTWFEPKLLSGLFIHSL